MQAYCVPLRDFFPVVIWSGQYSLATAASSAPPLLHWKRPEKPWSHEHKDQTKAFLGQLLQILIDAYSKWIGVFPTTRIGVTASMEYHFKTLPQMGFLLWQKRKHLITS